MRHYLTADTHFGHKNIIEYCERPFETLDEMNNTIIKNFNEIIKPDDVVYFLGDWCFKNSPGGKHGEGVPTKALEYLNQLNGYWVFFKGNHDRNNSLKTKLKHGIVEFGRQTFWLTHNPSDANPNFAVNLVGHVHEAWKIRKLTEKSVMYNVGVDVHNFRPVSFEDIITDIHRWRKNGSR